MKNLKAIDLFAGAGGLSHGLLQAGFEIVGAVEIDKQACETYEYNIGEHICNEDIINFPPSELEKFMKKNNLIISKGEIDLVAGGPPCPGFSNIGRSKISSLIKSGSWIGSDSRHRFIDDPRNKLFHEFVKYVKYFKPKYFLMENVSGMTSFKNPDEKSIVQVIKKEFEDIGYRVKIDVLNAAKYGVPQNRKRIFFLGWKPRSKEPKFPEKKSFEISSWDAIRDLPPAWIDKNENADERKNKLLTQLGSPGLSTPSLNFLQNMRERNNPNNSKKPSNITSLHRMRKVNPRDIGIFPLIKSGEFGEKVIFADLIPEEINFPPPWKWNKTKGTVWNGKTNKLLRKEYKWYNPGTFADKMRRIRGDKPAPTIVAHLTHDGYMFIHPRYNRTITVREAARLQSFPDSFDFSADGKVPWSKQFKQVGNAVPPILSKEIGLMIIKNLI